VCLAAWALLASAGGSSAAPPDRTLSLYHIHTHEILVSTYKKGGKYVPEEMAKIDWFLRDWRKDEQTRMDPELIDLVWEMHAELHSAEPVHIISAFRSRATNDMLRRTVGGQASESRHILGKAMDVHFPDVPVKNLRYSALIREKGGVGYYPTSAIPFVHVDIDRVRAWPRLPRAELALLFPTGRTQHLPTDGDPITRDDARAARTAHKELASQIAEFHELRTRPVQVASLLPPLPRLIKPPQLVERPLATRPSEAERARLAALAAAPRMIAAPAPAARPGTGNSGGAAMELAALDATGPAGRRGWGASLSNETAFVPAPAFDEEHPEELSYRPFPIAPLLTETASVDDPVLARMIHPDLAKTLEMLDQTGSAPPMRLRLGPQTAQVLWAQQFKGEAIDLSSFLDAEGSSSPAGMSSRKIVTRAP
jgi:uncharacterized protein YcbK (DUF882 family)